MAVRFVEGGYEYLDPMSGANPAGSALVYDDGVDTVAPWEDRPGYGQNDLIASDALRWMGTPRDQLAQTLPPVPQQLFPPRFGYNRTPLGIQDVFTPDLWAPRVRSWSWPDQRTPRRAYEEDQMWSGTDRNMSTSVNPML
jgi:hypothetical protein